MLKIISEFDLFDMIIFSMQGFNVGYKRLTITVIDPDIAVVFFPMFHTGWRKETHLKMA